jgi:hypothetical protein
MLRAHQAKILAKTKSQSGFREPMRTKTALVDLKPAAFTADITVAAFQLPEPLHGDLAGRLLISGNPIPRTKRPAEG